MSERRWYEAKAFSYLDAEDLSGTSVSATTVHEDAFMLMLKRDGWEQDPSCANANGYIYVRRPYTSQANLAQTVKELDESLCSHSSQLKNNMERVSENETRFAQDGRVAVSERTGLRQRLDGIAKSQEALEKALETETKQNVCAFGETQVRIDGWQKAQDRAKAAIDVVLSNLDSAYGRQEDAIKALQKTDDLARKDLAALQEQLPNLENELTTAKEQFAREMRELRMQVNPDRYDPMHVGRPGTQSEEPISELIDFEAGGAPWTLTINGGKR